MSSLVNSVKVTKGPEQLHAAKGNPMHKRYRKRHHHQHVEGKKEEKKKIKKNIYIERENCTCKSLCWVWLGWSLFSKTRMSDGAQRLDGAQSSGRLLLEGEGCWKQQV